jgi:hypothetical protein
MYNQNWNYSDPDIGFTPPTHLFYDNKAAVAYSHNGIETNNLALAFRLRGQIH